MIPAVLVLPTLPAIAARALTLVEDPNASVADLHEVVARDPGLAGAVLREANGPTRGFSGRLAAPSHAIVVLGPAELRRVLRGVPVLAFSPPAPSPGLEPSALVARAAARAECSRLAARALGLRLLEEAYAAGLFAEAAALERAGRDLALSRAPERRSPPGSRSGSGRPTPPPAEASARIVEAWSLPPEVAGAIRFTRAPSSAPETLRPLARALGAGEAMLSLVGAGLRPAPTGGEAETLRALAALGLSGTDASALLDRARTAAEKLAPFFALAGRTPSSPP